MMKKLGVVIGSLALVAGMGSALADDEPERVYVTPAPNGVTDQTYQEWNAPLFTGGVVLFGAAYGGAVIAASQSDNEHDDRLYVPLIGPWLDLADRGDCDVQNESCDDETTTKVLLVADGIFQAGGAALMVGSFLFPKTVHESAPITAMRHIKPVRVGTAGRGFAFSTTF